MENLKQLSVKIEPETLEKIDAIASRLTFWKRNAVINTLLTTLLREADERDIDKLIKHRFSTRYGIKITIEEYEKQ